MGSANWVNKDINCPYCNRPIPIIEGEIFPEHCPWSECNQFLGNLDCADLIDIQMGNSPREKDD